MRFDNAVKILNATWDSGSLKVDVMANGSISGVALVVYGRPKKFVYEKPDGECYPFLGGIQLPDMKPFEVYETTLRLSIGIVDAPSYWIDVFSCDEAGKVVGHFVGVTQLKRG